MNSSSRRAARRLTPLTDSSAVFLEGPWDHRMVSANGHRFHAVLTGTNNDAPLVVLLHGFPQFWWTWRHQLTALSKAGYRVAALDIRGYGASDKPPEGYDLPTLTSDIAGAILALGAPEAIVVGHGHGAQIAWAMSILTPDVVTAIATVSSPHPDVLTRRFRRLASPSAQRRTRYFQLPWGPERALTHNGLVGELLHEWAAIEPESWTDTDAIDQYESAIRVPFVAHSSLEYFRWLGRSYYRPDGRRFARRLRKPITQPVLQIHGGNDPALNVKYVEPRQGLIGGSYEFAVIEGAGHWPADETPTELSEKLVAWLKHLEL